MSNSQTIGHSSVEGFWQHQPETTPFSLLTGAWHRILQASMRRALALPIDWLCNVWSLSRRTTLLQWMSRSQRAKDWAMAGLRRKGLGETCISNRSFFQRQIEHYFCMFKEWCKTKRGTVMKWGILNFFQLLLSTKNYKSATTNAKSLHVTWFLLSFLSSSWTSNLTPVESWTPPQRWGWWRSSEAPCA